MAEGDNDRRGPGVAVVDRDIPDDRWQPIDLGGMQGLPPVSLSGGPMIPAGSAPAFSLPARPPITLRSAPRPAASRLPASVFVQIGADRTNLTRRRYAKRGARPSANDNALSPAASRSLWRELFFLAVLVVTVVGAFYSGRLHGFQRVHVIPVSSTAGVVIT